MVSPTMTSQRRSLIVFLAIWFASFLPSYVSGNIPTRSQSSTPNNTWNCAKYYVNDTTEMYSRNSNCYNATREQMPMSSLEGSDPILMGLYSSRSDSNKLLYCSKAAAGRGFNAFILHNNGKCYSSSGAIKAMSSLNRGYCTYASSPQRCTASTGDPCTLDGSSCKCGGGYGAISYLNIYKFSNARDLDLWVITNNVSIDASQMFNVSSEIRKTAFDVLKKDLELKILQGKLCGLGSISSEFIMRPENESIMIHVRFSSKFINSTLMHENLLGITNISSGRIYRTQQIHGRCPENNRMVATLSSVGSSLTHLKTHYRSQVLSKKVSINFYCKSPLVTYYQMQLAKLSEDNKNFSNFLTVCNKTAMNVTSVSDSTCRLEPRSLEYGVYYVKLESWTPEDVAMVGFYQGFLNVTKGPLIAVIEGGSTAKQAANVLLFFNASSSYDPEVYKSAFEAFDVPDRNYTWVCYKNGESVSLSTPQAIHSLPIVKYGVTNNVGGGCFGSGPGRLTQRGPRGFIDTRSMALSSAYVLFLIIEKDTRFKSASNTFTIVPAPPAYNTTCVNNCMSQMKTNSRLALKAVCISPSCSKTTIPHTITWIMSKDSGRRTSEGMILWYAVDGLASMSLMPITSSSILLKENSLEKNTTYRLSLRALHSGGGERFAHYIFHTNIPPQHGTCLSDRTKGVAVADEFTFTCEGWQDENKPLSYECWALSGGSGVDKLLSFGLNSSVTTRLPVGNSSQNYNLVIRCTTFDTFFEGTDFLFNVTVEPPEDPLKSIGEHLSGPDSELEDADDQKTLQLCIAGLSLLDDEFSGNATAQNKTKTRDHMVTAIANMSANGTQGITQITGTLIECTSEKKELSVESQMKSVEAAANMTLLLEEEGNSTSTDTKVLDTAGGYLLHLCGNVIDGASLTNDNEGDEDDGDEDDGTEGSTNTSSVTKQELLKSVSQKALNSTDTLAEFILSKMLPGEPMKNFTSPTFGLSLTKTSIDAIPTSVDVKGCSIEVPDTISSLLEDSIKCGNRSCQDNDMLAVTSRSTLMKSNPYFWGEDRNQTKRVNIPVLSLSYTTPSGEQIGVNNLTQSFKIQIPIESAKKPENASEFLSFVTPGEVCAMHKFLVENDNTVFDLVIKLKEEVYVTVYVRRGLRPNYRDHDYEFYHPDLSSCVEPPERDNCTGVYDFNDCMGIGARKVDGNSKKACANLTDVDFLYNSTEARNFSKCISYEDQVTCPPVTCATPCDSDNCSHSNSSRNSTSNLGNIINFGNNSSLGNSSHFNCTNPPLCKNVRNFLACSNISYEKYEKCKALLKKKNLFYGKYEKCLRNPYRIYFDLKMFGKKGVYYAAICYPAKPRPTEVPSTAMPTTDQKTTISNRNMTNGVQHTTIPYDRNGSTTGGYGWRPWWLPTPGNRNTPNRNTRNRNTPNRKKKRKGRNKRSTALAAVRGDAWQSDLEQKYVQKGSRDVTFRNEGEHILSDLRNEEFIGKSEERWNIVEKNHEYSTRSDGIVLSSRVWKKLPRTDAGSHSPIINSLPPNKVMSDKDDSNSRRVQQTYLYSRTISNQNNNPPLNKFEGLVAENEDASPIDEQFVVPSDSFEVHSRNRRGLSSAIATAPTQNRRCIVVEEKPAPTPHPPPTSFPPVIQQVLNKSTSLYYSFSVNLYSCLYWNVGAERWDTDGCTPHSNSTPSLLICMCNHLTSFSGGLIVAPNPIDFDEVFANFANIAETGNFSVLFTVIGVFLLYVIAVILGRRADKKDKILAANAVLSVQESNQGGYNYEISVYTGMFRGSGTTANAAMVICGDHEDSSVFPLTDRSGKSEELLSRGSVAQFMVNTPHCLGPLSYIKIWHNNAGDDPSWFLRQVVIRDVQTDNKYFFLLSDWLAVDKGAGEIERRILTATKKEMAKFRNLFYTHTAKSFSDKHIWISVVLRSPTSLFTRVQRVTCCLSLLLCAMLANAMFYEKVGGSKSDTVKIGTIKFSLRQVIVGIQSSFVVAPINILIISLFRKARAKDDKTRASKYESIEGNPSSKNGELHDDDKDVGNANANMSPDSSTKTKTKCSLPYWSVYIAYSLCFFSSLISAAIVTSYSMIWGTQKSSEWMISIMVSLIQDIFVVQPLKVIVIAALLSFLFRKPPEDDDVIDKKEKTYEGSFGNMDISDENPDSSPFNSYEPLSKDELTVTRDHTSKKNKMKTVFNEIGSHLIFFILLSTVTLGGESTHRYRLRNHMENVFQKIEKVWDARLFWWWCDKYLVPGLYDTKWYNGRNFTDEEGFMSTKKAFLVGMPSIRQSRVKPVKCVAAKDYPLLQRMFPNCYPSYTLLNMDDSSAVSKLTQNGTISLNDSVLNAEIGFERICLQPFMFQTADALGTLPVVTNGATYAPGGLVADLGYEKDTAKEVLLNLKEDNWINRKTRGIFIDFVAFEPASNLFAVVRFTFEIKSTGKIHPSYQIETLSLYGTGSAAFDVILTVCQILLVLTIIFLFIREILKMYKERLSYFKDIWNVLDIFLFSLAVATMVLHYLKVTYVGRMIRKIQENPFARMSFDYVVFGNHVWKALASVVIFLATLKLLKLLKFNRKIITFAQVMKVSKPHLISFSAIFMVTFMAFAQLGNLVFGNDLIMYSTMLRSFVNEFEMILGKGVSFYQLTTVSPKLGPFFIFFYFMITTLLLVNFFVTILNDSYEVGRKNIEQENSEDLLLAMFMSAYLKSSLKNISDDLKKIQGENLRQESKRLNPETDIDYCNFEEERDYFLY